MDRPTLVRVMRCTVCEKQVAVASLDSPHPEAPTLFQALHPEVSAPWFGIVDGKTLIVCCSAPCAQALLDE